MVLDHESEISKNWKEGKTRPLLMAHGMQVTNGKNAMPAWAGRLSEDEIQDVAAYVYDQASGDKW